MIESVTIVSKSGKGNIEIGMDGHQEYWLDSVNWSQAEGSHQSYTHYGQVGSSIVSTSILTRPLQIIGWVVEDDTPLQTKCNFLNGFISVVEDYILRFNDYEIGFRPDISVKYGDEEKTNNIKMRRFLIQATCPYPLFSKTVATVVPFDFSQKRFRFPTDFGQKQGIIFATTEKLYNTTIQNPGGFNTGVTITIAFKGTVTNPRIKDLATGDVIGVDMTFVNGDKLIMSTPVGSKSMVRRTDDGKETDVIRNRNVNTVWLQLNPGENTWAIECDNLAQRDAMDVLVSFTPLYMEVE